MSSGESEASAEEITGSRLSANNKVGPALSASPTVWIVQLLSSIPEIPIRLIRLSSVSSVSSVYFSQISIMFVTSVLASQISDNIQ